MKYADTIRFHSDKELNVEEKKKHLVSIMDSERLSTVSSICLDSKNKIAYVVKKISSTLARSKLASKGETGSNTSGF